MTRAQQVAAFLRPIAPSAAATGTTVVVRWGGVQITLGVTTAIGAVYVNFPGGGCLLSTLDRPKAVARLCEAAALLHLLRAETIAAGLAQAVAAAEPGYIGETRAAVRLIGEAKIKQARTTANNDRREAKLAITRGQQDLAVAEARIAELDAIDLGAL